MEKELRIIISGGGTGGHIGRKDMSSCSSTTDKNLELLSVVEEQEDISFLPSLSQTL